jgi:hypothetical protein
MVVHVCNPSTWEAKARDCEFKGSLVYIVNSRAVYYTVRPCFFLKKYKTRKKKERKEQ